MQKVCIPIKMKYKGLYTSHTCDMRYSIPKLHYSDVIMGAMASLITGAWIVYLTVYSGADQRKHQSSASLAFFEGKSPVTGEFPSQRANNGENVSIWWRHHVDECRMTGIKNDTNTMILLAFPQVKLGLSNQLHVTSPDQQKIYMLYLLNIETETCREAIYHIQDWWNPYDYNYMCIHVYM